MQEAEDLDTRELDRMRILAAVALLAVMMFSLAAGLAPGWHSAVPPGLIHFAVGAALTILVGIVFRRIWIAAVVVLALSFGLEIAQFGIPERSFSFTDIAADLIGICAGLLILTLMRRLQPRFVTGPR